MASIFTGKAGIDVDLTGTAEEALASIDASGISDELKTLFKANYDDIKALGPGKLVDYETETVRIQL
tara:strand:+ start:3727 stop:3927 length:201 start_codon:yes stop_codon:yes gene_type:complete